MRIIITGGGTGGHIYPALAIAEGIRRRHPEAELLYVGTERGLEAEIVPRSGYNFRAVPAAGLKRSPTPRNLLAVLLAGQGLLASWTLVRHFHPDVVVGTGGYVCGPVVLAAALQGIKTLIHEQNAVPGLTNRILSRFADRTAITFMDAVKYFPRRARIVLTGLPVRPEILAVKREESRKKLGLSKDEFVVVSFGGSRGARSLNLALVPVVQALSRLPGWKLFHAAGTVGFEEFRQALEVTCHSQWVHGSTVSDGCSVIGDSGSIAVISPYFHDIATLLGAADLVVCRAGASTIAELTVLGLPGILAPYPYATGNHQEFNARALSERGAAVLIHDREMTGELLLSTIMSLRNEPRKLAIMGQASRSLAKPWALNNLLDSIEKLAGAKKK